MHIESNIKGLCQRFGLDYNAFLEDMGVEHPSELAISDLEIIAEEHEVDLYSLIFKPTFFRMNLADKLNNIKLLVLDVDGVMTDGGMYVTESGDQFKKFNTKDGMAIIHLTKNDFQVAIISSGFKGEAVQQRAITLGIQHCVVSRTQTIDTLREICITLGIELNQVAMIGDDINDLEVMRAIGLTFCPKDAVPAVKSQVDVVLTKNGGEGCVRELIDNYLLEEPVNR